MLSSVESLLGQLRQKPWIGATLGFILGLIIGLPILGWYVFPVQWYDADVVHLRADLQDDYVRMAAGAYAQNRDIELAARRMAGFGAETDAALQHAIAASQPPEAQQIADLQIAVEQYRQAVGEPAPNSEAGGGAAQWFLPFAALLLMAVVLAAMGAYAWTRLRQAPSVAVDSPLSARRAGASTTTATVAAEMPTLISTGAAVPVAAKPIGRFMTTYTLGDDVYDETFSIDSADGNLLGECGMGISETIGVGDPKKVTAFEVWLFDKNDIRTVTKVLMSEHAFRDEALKSRLAAKGEPVSALAGETLSLETATLVVTARIVDMAYGGGALPPSSFFERMTIELLAFRKD